MLIRNLDQPARSVRADPTQWAPVSSVQQTVSQTGRDAGNSGHLLDAERAACHQIPQLSPKRPRIDPLTGSFIARGEQSHTSLPFVESLYL
jgi:hypothetical protein